VLDGQRQQHAQIVCDETTESLLEIHFFNVTVRAGILNAITWSLRAPSSASSSSFFSASSSSFVEYYHSYQYADEVVPYYAQCISRDDCAIISIENLDPSSNFMILFDGEDVAPTHTFGSIEDQVMQYSRTEIGPCVPECGDDESLFQLEAFAAFYVNPVPWKLQDLSSGKTLTSCEIGSSRLCRSDVGTDIVRYCLPRDGCYSFLAGTLPSTGYGKLEQPLTSFNVTFDGTPVANFENFHFESLQFGGGAPCASNTSSLAACNVGESAVELSLYRYNDPRPHSYPKVLWSFLLNGESTLKNGVFLSKKEGMLEYVHECIRLDDDEACIALGLSVPETFRVKDDNCRYNVSYPYYFPYRLTVDGVIVAEDDFSFQAFDDRKPEVDPTAASCSGARSSAGATAGILVGSIVGSLLVVLGVV
jgi:hypothetical protein